MALLLCASACRGGSDRREAPEPSAQAASTARARPAPAAPAAARFLEAVEAGVARYEQAASTQTPIPAVPPLAADTMAQLQRDPQMDTTAITAAFASVLWARRGAGGVAPEQARACLEGLDTRDPKLKGPSQVSSALVAACAPEQRPAMRDALMRVLAPQLLTK